MAVVQISKIQIRRGLKSATGSVPQLSSAEMAWAVDTQELFIGSGSVAEGAPEVENVKILTEKDNILELASSYTFAEDDFAITASIPRSLQSKLDEYVSVLDFGAANDGSTDCVDAFETAFTQLFRNTDTTYRKVLKIPNGEYLFLSDLEIPSYAIIEGETRDGVILNISSNNIRLVSDIETSASRTESVSISNVTIQRTSGQTVLSKSNNTSITNVKFLGEYVLGEPITLISEPAAVYWISYQSQNNTDNVTIRNCVFENNSVAIRSDIENENTEVDAKISLVENIFIENDTGIYLNNNIDQTSNWLIRNCAFEEIAERAFFSVAGTGTLIQDCDFKNCGIGNSTNDAGNPVWPFIWFGQSDGNRVLNCTSNRMQAVTDIVSASKANITEVYNADIVSFNDRILKTVNKGDELQTLSVFPAENRFIFVNYTLRLKSEIRVGKLTMTLDEDFEHVSLTDEYQYSSSLTTGPRGTLMTGFQFFVDLADNTNGSDESTLADMVDTIVLYYRNPQSTGADGDISFDVTYGV